jgi:predicted Zn-dependent protease
LEQDNNISQNLLETVERYINKTMTKDELLKFEEKLQDFNFKTQVDDIKTLLLGIETQSLKEQLDEFHQEILEHKSTKKTSPKVRFLNFKNIAAAAAIIIAIGSFVYFGGNSNQKLYAKYFKPDPGLPTTMSSNTNFEFYDAMVYYKHGDYNIAISKWEKLLNNKPKNDTLNYFLGVAYLANKDETNAITHLNTALQNPENNFKNETYYYLGLAYLKSGKVELAKTNLNLSNMDNSKILLSEIKK